MVKKSETDNKADEQRLVEKIIQEVAELPQYKDYSLSDFTYEKTLNDTSPTLLSFISKLVSDGSTNKKSLSLAQCIQQHIGMANGCTQNQTPFGLAVMLHHKFGSADLINVLHEHGITSSYKEVLRFRKSVASYVFKNAATYHEKLGLSSDIGPIFGWFDNYDLYIASPNGTKSMHAMVSEFTVHPNKVAETQAHIDQ